MMPIAKIAFMSGMSESNVKTTLHRTRGAFREHLEKEGITI
jgi:DNA-directed RNA polymerase specialized sigma24 family protein